MNCPWKEHADILEWKEVEDLTAEESLALAKVEVIELEIQDLLEHTKQSPDSHELPRIISQIRLRQAELRILELTSGKLAGCSNYACYGAE